MKLTKSEFLEQPKKSLTLMGMSGVGKSHLANKFEQWGWSNYSCDYLIGTKYLVDEVKGDITKDHIGALSDFVGQMGNPEKGGVQVQEFRRRQTQYYNAERQALGDMGAALSATSGSFVHDSAGSMCEIDDDEVMAEVGKQTLFVYLKVKEEDHAEILRRAILDPKPLYFPPTFFDKRLVAYCTSFSIESPDKIDPKGFLSWVFPYLFEARLPKYQALADEYGVTVSAEHISNAVSEGEALNIIAEALDD